MAGPSWLEGMSDNIHLVLGATGKTGRRIAARLRLEAVRSSSVDWTILRASNFAQNFDEDLFHAPLVAGELALMESGLIAETTEDLSAVLGKEPRTFEDHVVRAAAAGAWDERRPSG